MRTPIAIVLWLVVAVISSPLFAQIQPATTRPLQPPVDAAIVAFHGQVNDFNQNAFIRHFNQAKAAGAKVIIVDIDTDGGLVTSALHITRFLKSQTDVRTIAYIGNRAYSAGSMIAVACNEIVMATSASLGDCAPIMVDSTGALRPLPETERSKAESPILADFEDSAHRNGYSVPLVMSMVTLKPIYYIEGHSAGDRRYVAIPPQTYKEGLEQGLWKPVPGSPNPVLISNELLTVSGERAKELGLAKAIEPSTNALAAARNYRIVGVYQTGIGEQILAVLNSGPARAILLGIFLTCLFVALHAPGHGFAEVLAALTLSVLLGVPLLTGYAQWWEIIFILVGIGLLALEIFVIPGFGIAGFTGIAFILIGFLLTFVAPEPGRSPLSIPHMPMTWDSLQKGLIVTVSGLACGVLLCMWLRRYLPRLPYFNRLILNTTVGAGDSAMVGSLTNIDPIETGPAIGASGKAVTDLRPGGSAEFMDPAGVAHIVSVVSDSGFVLAGTRIIVREVAGSRIVVRPSATEARA